MTAAKALDGHLACPVVRPADLTACPTSIVLITRNQAWNMAMAIDAALTELGNCGGGELIVVDSASDDGTLDRARSYPVGLVELSGARSLTPARGRWIGSRLARGESILFLDGDMKLAPGWLKLAQRALFDETVGCVTGSILWGGEAHESTADTPGTRDIPWFQGAALIRRDVLEQVGTFNPVLRSEEESELSMRMRASGYRIVALSRPIATHPASDGDPIGAILARRRRGLYLGFGQVLKLHATAPSRMEYLRHRAFWIPPASGVAGAVGALVAARRARSGIPLVAAGALAGLLGAYLVNRKGGFRPAIASVVSRAAILEGTIKGLALPARPPQGFEPTFRVLREPPAIAARA